MIGIVREGIDVMEMIKSAKRKDCGAIAAFFGTVRDMSEGERVHALYIEAYEDMALEQLRDIRDRAMERYGVKEVSIVHRIGEMGLGDVIVGIAVSSPHRAEAFKACMFVIDEIKKRAPLWKKERRESGEVWVKEVEA